MKDPIQKFSKKAKGSIRTFGVFLCDDCSTEVTTRMDHKRDVVRCMDCSRIAVAKKRSTHGFNNKNSRLHCTWANMKRRCLNPTPKEKRNYCGITLCPDWMDFEPFMLWAIGNGYDDTKTIDRIDNLSGYSPDNCRFVDVSTQNANKSKYRATKSGFLGVFWESKGWRAKVQWRGKQIHLGRFQTAHDAAIARDEYVKENSLPHTLNFPKYQLRHGKE